MRRIDDPLRNLLIPINTRRESTPPSSSVEPTTEPAPADVPAVVPPGVPASRSAVCPICRGAGYMTLDVPITDPNFGRLFACDCMLRDIQERNFAELEQRGVTRTG